MAPDKLKYEVGHPVMLKEQKESTFGYAAKVIKTERVDGVNKYTFHYNGWNARWDRTLSEDELDDVVYQWSKEAEQESKEKQKEATRSTMKKKKIGDDKKKNEPGSSRASTPSVTSEMGSTKRRRRGADDSSSVGSHEGSVSTATPSQPKETLQKRREIRINIPDKMRALLLDDEDLILRQQKVFRLPARFTIDHIVTAYVSELKEKSNSGAEEFKDPIDCTLGVMDYFNSVVGCQLLYKFERPQYVEYCKNSNPAGMDEQQRCRPANNETLELPEEDLTVVPSSVYGLPHLARLFTRIGPLLCQTIWSERNISSIIQHLQDFVKWLSINSERFFDLNVDYDVASPSYVKMSFHNL